MRQSRRPQPSLRTEVASRSPAERRFSRRRFVQGATAGAVSVAAYSAWPAALRVRAADQLRGLAVSPGLSGDFAAAAAQPGLFEQLFAQAAELGARTIRFPLDWSLVEATPRVYDWSAYGDLHREFVWNGLQGVPVLLNAPAWLGDTELRETPGGLRYPVGDGGLNALEEMAVQTALHFSTYGSVLQAIEVWARPNVPGATHIADPADFGHLVESVGLAVSGLMRPGQRVPEPIEVLAGAVATDGADDWRRYVEAAMQEQGLDPIGVSLDFPGGLNAEGLRDAVGAAAERVSGLTDGGLWLNVGACTVDREGSSGWETFKGIAAATDLPSCRGVTINPLHNTVSGESRVVAAASYPDAAPLLTDDWKQTNAFAAVEDAWR